MCWDGYSLALPATGLIIYALLYVNIWYVHCFVCVPMSSHMFAVSHNNMYFQCRGKSLCLFIAILQMFTVWQMSRQGVNNMLSFIQYKHFKCSLFCIYPLVGVENMCTFLQQYFKCSLFRIYPRVGANNIPTFISICQMFTISHTFLCRRK